MTDILETIVENKKVELDDTRKLVPVSLLMEMAAEMLPARDFKKALKAGGMQIIAEAKKASPSRGLLCPDFDPARLAKAYEANGAAAISVLTESRFFLGKLDYLKEVKAATGIPVLRKDFITDPYQVYESRAAGADAILLIAAILERSSLSELLALSSGMGMDCLVEVHNEQEIEAALSCGAGIIGINNRDLKTFITDVSVTTRLRRLLPPDITVVSESGINGKAEIDILRDNHVDAFLIGEALVKAADPGARLREMRKLLQ
jgi:indole-3-glycerol phosphate synthase